MFLSGLVKRIRDDAGAAYHGVNPFDGGQGWTNQAAPPQVIQRPIPVSQPPISVGVAHPQQLNQSSFTPPPAVNQVTVAAPQNLNAGNSVIAPRQNMRTLSPGQNAQLQTILHPSLGDQVRTQLSQKLEVPSAAAHEVGGMAQQFVGRPLVTFAGAVTGKQQTFDNPVTHVLAGNAPVQNLQKNVANTYDSHPNLPTPVRYGLAVGDAAGQVLNVIPDAAVIGKSGRVISNGAKAVEASEAVRNVKQAASMVPRTIHYDQLTLQDYSNHLSGVKPLTPGQLNGTIEKAREIANRHGINLATGSQMDRLDKVNSILDKVKADNRATSEGGYVRVRGGTPSEGNTGKPPQIPKAEEALQETTKGISSTPSVPPEVQAETGYRSSHQIAVSTAIHQAPVNDMIAQVKSKYGLTNYDQKDIANLKKIASNPEADVKIYRSAPKNELNHGDWVTTSKSYAQDIKRQNGGKVNEFTVKAKELHLPNNIEDNPSLARFSAFKYQKEAHQPTQAVIPKASDLALRDDAEANVFAQNPLPRSQKSGFALSQPDKEVASLDQIVGRGDPTRVHELPPPTPEQSTIRSAGLSADPLDSSRGVSPVSGRSVQTESQLRARIEPSQPQRTSNTESLSSDNTLPQDITDAISNGTYPVKRKVNVVDYLRTPANVLKKIGLEKQAQALRDAEHTYKQELPGQIERIRQWRNEVKNVPDASQHIFQYLDGQKIKLNPAEAKVAREMKSALEEWAVRLKIPPEHRISNYITHIFDETIQGKEFDPEFEKLIADKVAGSVYDPYTQQRLGAKGYIEDAFQAIEAYTKRGVRKANMDPALETLSNAAKSLDLSSWTYVKRYGDRINMRPTELDNLIDNAIKQTPVGYRLGARPVARISRDIRQATFRASLGLNVGSAIRNLTQGINTFAELGTKWTGIGYTKALQNIATKSDELYRTGVLDNSFVEDRTLSASKQLLQKADEGLFAFFQAAEKVNRGAAYYGAKAKALAADKSEAEAIRAGVDAARKTQFTFGKVDTPVALQSDIVKLVTQFQSYNVKQAEFIGEMVKNKEFAKLLRLTGASAVVMGTVGKAMGWRPTDMIPSAQIAGTPAFKLPGDIYGLAKAELTAKDNQDSTRQQQIQKKAMKFGSDVGSATVPAFTQAKKTITGIKAVNRGEVKKGNKVYVVDKNIVNYVKGAALGPYSLNGQSKSQAKLSGTQSITPASNNTVTINGVKYNTSTPEARKKDAQASFEENLNPEAKQFFALPSDQQKQLAKQNPRFQKYLDEKNAVNQAYGTPVEKAKGLPGNESSTIDKYNRLTSDAQKKYLDDPKNKYDYETANLDNQLALGKVSEDDAYKKQRALEYERIASENGIKSAKDAKDYFDTPQGKFQLTDQQYQLDVANNKLSPEEEFKQYDKLQKLSVEKDYSKEAVELYGMSKTNIERFLDAKGASQEIRDELLKLDQAYIDAGLSKRGKFGGSGGGGGGGRKSKTGFEGLNIKSFSTPSLPSPPKPSISTKGGIRRGTRVSVKSGKPAKITVRHSKV